MTIKRYDVGPRMSQCVEHGDTVYLAGLVADDASGDASDQTRQILEKIDAYLAQAGSDKSKLLQCHIWLKDMSDYAAFNALWDAWIVPGEPPARACVRADLVMPEWLVEVMVIAAK